MLKHNRCVGYSGHRQERMFSLIYGVRDVLTSVMSCVRMTFLRNVFCLFFLIYHSVSRAITYFNARLSLKNDVNNTLIGQCGTFIIYIYHANKQNKN